VSCKPYDGTNNVVRNNTLVPPDTYQKALQLYATRNKIAHRRQPPADAKYFSVTKGGSQLGLATAIDVFGWLGDSGPYCIPTDMVYADTGKPPN